MSYATWNLKKENKELLRIVSRMADVIHEFAILENLERDIEAADARLLEAEKEARVARAEREALKSKAIAYRATIGKA